MPLLPSSLRTVPHGGQVARGAPPVRRACPSLQACARSLTADRLREALHPSAVRALPSPPGGPPRREVVRFARVYSPPPLRYGGAPLQRMRHSVSPGPLWPQLGCKGRGQIPPPAEAAGPLHPTGWAPPLTGRRPACCWPLWPCLPSFVPLPAPTPHRGPRLRPGSICVGAGRHLFARACGLRPVRPSASRPRPKPRGHLACVLAIGRAGARHCGRWPGLRPRAPPSRTSGRVAGESRAERGCPSSLRGWPTRSPIPTRLRPTAPPKPPPPCATVDRARHWRALRRSPASHRGGGHTRTMAPRPHRLPTRHRALMPTHKPRNPPRTHRQRGRWPGPRSALRGMAVAASSPPGPAVECTAAPCRRVGGPLRVEHHPPPDNASRLD